MVRTPQNGSALQIEGHPIGISSPTVRDSIAAGSSPGEIYPDGVDVPTAGCWQFKLKWATGETQVELEYVAH